MNDISNKNSNYALRIWFDSSAKQEYYENVKFRTNSEFDDKAGMKKNAYILLVLDTSKSLGSQASNVKKLAQDIILYINTEICGE